jgi:anti-sigma B factor antagonist
VQSGPTRPTDPADSTFAISIRRLGPERASITVEGELDLSSADQLKQALLDEFRDGRSVVLDLAGVRFVDSTGLGAILSGTQGAADGELVFEVRSELQPQVQRLMELTGVIPMLTFVD